MKFIVMVFLSFLSLSAFANPVAVSPVDDLSDQQVVAIARLDKMAPYLRQIIQPALTTSHFQSRVDVMAEFTSVAAARQYGLELGIKVDPVANNVFAFTVNVKELLYTSSLPMVVQLDYNGPLSIPEQPGGPR